MKEGSVKGHAEGNTFERGQLCVKKSETQENTLEAVSAKTLYCFDVIMQAQQSSPKIQPHHSGYSILNTLLLLRKGGKTKFY